MSGSDKPYAFFVTLPLVSCDVLSDFDDVTG